MLGVKKGFAFLDHAIPATTYISLVLLSHYQKERISPALKLLKCSNLRGQNILENSYGIFLSINRQMSKKQTSDKKMNT